MSKRGFCERNLVPHFSVLVLLIGATIAAAVAKGKYGWGESAARAPGGVAAALDAGAPAAPASAEAVAAPQPTPVALGPGQPTVDAVAMATPNGGLRLIAQPAGLTGPVADRSRLVFNTVSSVVLPATFGIHAARGVGAPTAWENVGSGFVIDARGFALTTYHVVAEAAALSVAVPELGDFQAVVAGADPQADLALLQIMDAPPLPEVRLGDSHAVRTGDWVLAFGSPFGLDQTVTQGIVSNRWAPLVVAGTSFGEMLQTDAPINPGSSGGPLVDLNAQVIGINTAIYGVDAGFSGTGFAIPIDRARSFLAKHAALLER